MAWDIHGRALKPGHCEVHPEVPLPYPCHLCLAETAQYERQRDVSDLQTYIAEKKASDPEFAKEYDALGEEYAWRNELVRLKTRVAALEEALRPFRLETAIVLPSHDDSSLVTAYIRIGDIRKARKVYEGKG